MIGKKWNFSENDYFKRFCGSKNYPYLPHWRGFCLDFHPPPPPPTPTSLKIPVKLHTFTYNFGPLRTPTHPSQDFPIPSVGVVWIFSGTTHWISISTTKGIMESKDSHIVLFFHCILQTKPSVNDIVIYRSAREYSLICLSNMTNLHWHPYTPGSFDMPDQVKYIVYKVITAACNSPELGWPYESKAKFKINMLMKIAESFLVFRAYHIPIVGWVWLSGCT